MIRYVIELIVISILIFGTLGFNNNAVIALLLYYSRKLILFYVGTQLVSETN